MHSPSVTTSGVRGAIGRTFVAISPRPQKTIRAWRAAKMETGGHGVKTFPWRAQTPPVDFRDSGPSMREQTMHLPQLTLDRVVHQRERLRLAVILVVSVLVYAVVVLVAMSDPRAGGVILLYGCLFAIAG